VESPGTSEAAPDRPDVFLSYAREDAEFVEGRLTRALVAHGKNVWIDVEDIRGGASDWRASVWAGIESAKVVVFVLTPDSLASTVCGEELQRADELNKRIVPVLRRPVDGLPVPPPLERPNWILARPNDDFETSVAALVGALELDEPWVEQHARLTQRTAEWLRHDRDGSYLLRGSDLRDAERWLDDRDGHREAPTTDQVTYIPASRRAAARRQRGLLGGVGLALAVTAVLALVAVAQWRKALDREQRAKTQAARALAAQSLAELPQDPEASVRAALEAVELRPALPEVVFALRRVVSSAGWTSILRLPASGDVRLQDVEYTDGGTRLATAGSDGRVAVWDARSGRRIAVLTTPGAVRTVQFSPDGRRLLTASRGGLAQTWDSSTGRLLRELPTGTNDVWAATWGAGGRRILTATARAGKVWNAAGGAPLTLPSVGGAAGAIRMSLDGRRALTAGKNGTARLWNLVSGARTTLPGPARSGPLVFSLLSDDARRFATFYASGAFCVWDDRRVRPRLCAPRGVSTDADLSRDGRRALRAGGNGVVSVWDADSAGPKPIARLRTGAPVDSAQFDRSGDYVVTGSDDGDAQVWRVRPTLRLSVLHGHTAGVRRARFSPDGLQVATVSNDGSARLWPARPRAPSDPRWQSADSTSFAPGSPDVLVVRGRARAVWHTRTGDTVVLDGGGIALPGAATWPCGRAAGCAPWSPVGPQPRVTGVDARGGAVVWDARTGAVVATLGARSPTAVEAAFSPDGRRVAVVDGNARRARLWNVASAKPAGRVPVRAAPSALFSAQFVAAGRVVTVDQLGNVQLTAAGTVKLPGAAFPPAVASAGGRIALGTLEGELRLFSGSGRPLEARRAGHSAITTVAFSPGGGAVVAGDQSGTVTVWNLRTGRTTRLSASTAAISGAAFNPGGTLILVTAGATARVWDRALRRAVAELPRSPEVRAEFSPDGRRIALAGRTRLEVVPCVACVPLPELRRRAQSLLPVSS